MKLVVISSFGEYLRGQEVTNPEEVAALLVTNPAQVVKVAEPAAEDATHKAPPSA